MFLNCTMPALVNSRVGSCAGTSDELCTTVWVLSLKKSRKLSRISFPDVMTPLDSIPASAKAMLIRWPVR